MDKRRNGKIGKEGKPNKGRTAISVVEVVDLEVAVRNCLVLSTLCRIHLFTQRSNFGLNVAAKAVAPAI